MKHIVKKYKVIQILIMALAVYVLYTLLKPKLEGLEDEENIEK